MPNELTASYGLPFCLLLMNWGGARTTRHGGKRSLGQPASTMHGAVWTVVLLVRWTASKLHVCTICNTCVFCTRAITQECRQVVGAIFVHHICLIFAVVRTSLAFLFAGCGAFHCLCQSCSLYSSFYHLCLLACMCMICNVAHAGCLSCLVCLKDSASFKTSMRSPHPMSPHPFPHPYPRSFRLTGSRRKDSPRKKRLAVPFRAHNQPSDRSEWAHPDAALLLTTLAYYYDGLTLGEMAEALRALLGMAPSTQAYFYNGWLAACERPGASIASARTAAPGSDRVADERGAAGSEFEAEEWAAIDMVEKVDMTNKVKLALIHRKLGRNARVVNFWLAYCLFPRETNQFEKRMSASAWDLAQASGSNGTVIGFSGTNDLHRLMPLQVRQNDLPALQGTSGKMLDLLLREEERDGSYTTLKAGTGPSWQAALDLCMARGVDALLDAGAFLVGASNRGAAEYLLPSMITASASGSATSDAAATGANDVFFSRQQGIGGGGVLILTQEVVGDGTGQGVQQQQQQQPQQQPPLQQQQQQQPPQPPPPQRRFRARRQPLPQQEQQVRESLRAAFRGRFRGVVYFDTARREWMVRDRSGSCVPLSRSPIAPADAFVIFDESRCRGTDLKLRPDALALLTLSARMTKDKLMQAAGRMRQLDKGQRLLLVGNEELSNKVVTANGLVGPQASSWEGGSLVSDLENQAGRVIRPSHVMRVVMANTVAATEEGLMHATLQGVHFGSTYGAPHRALVDDDLSLWTMYQSALAEEWAAQMVDRMVSQGQARCDASDGLDGDMATMLAGIRARGRKYGGDFLVVVSLASLGGECERELEIQAEKEQEQEVQLPTYKPREEPKWDYAAILGVQSSKDLPTNVLSLKDAMPFLLPPTLQDMPWPANVFMTYNFLHGTVENDVGAGSPPVHGAKLNEFLRVVDVVVYFGTTGEALLLSEQEADGVLAVLWERDGLIHASSAGSRPDSVMSGPSSLVTNQVALLHLSYACGHATAAYRPKANQTAAEAGESLGDAAVEWDGRRSLSFLCGQPPALPPAPPAAFPCDASIQALPARSATSLLLFSGATSYRKQEHREELRRLLRRDGSVARELVAMRGRLHYFPRSDLDHVAFHDGDPLPPDLDEPMDLPPSLVPATKQGLHGPPPTAALWPIHSHSMRRHGSDRPMSTFLFPGHSMWLTGRRADPRATPFGCSALPMALPYRVGGRGSRRGRPVAVKVTKGFSVGLRDQCWGHRYPHGHKGQSPRAGHPAFVAIGHTFGMHSAGQRVTAVTCQVSKVNGLLPYKLAC
eukprot:jgi/Mesvir1/15198/Mv06434-RA.1